MPVQVRLSLPIKEIMQTIYKYELEVVDDQVLMLPLGAQILTVQLQYGKPVLWAVVDLPKRALLPVTIKTYGTGIATHDNLDRADYVGTYQLNEGHLVFHVFSNCGINVN